MYVKCTIFFLIIFSKVIRQFNQRNVRIKKRNRIVIQGVVERFEKKVEIWQ